MLPLSRAVAATTPDRQKLFPLEDALLKRYLGDLHLTAVPATLDAYLSTVVTPTLEAQRKGGCIGVKFEAAYLRALDFDVAPAEAAGRVYARYARGGVPDQIRQTFVSLSRVKPAGSAWPSTSIRSKGSATTTTSPARTRSLQSALDDPALRQTMFVINGGRRSGAPARRRW
jgi:hypothetical protein